MNHTRALTVGLAIPALVAVSAIAVGPANGSQGASSAVGTWQMTIDIQPFTTANGPVDPPPFPSLISFNRGGTMTETVSSVPGLAREALQANGATSGLGAWKQRDDRIVFTFKKFLTKDGAMVGWQVVEGSGSADQGSTAQDATAAFYNAAGVQVGPKLAVRATGIRMTP